MPHRLYKSGQPVLCAGIPGVLYWGPAVGALRCLAVDRAGSGYYCLHRDEVPVRVRPVGQPELFPEGVISNVASPSSARSASLPAASPLPDRRPR